MKLHNAARNGDLGAIAATIGANADLNEKDQHSRTPLLMACWSGQTEAVKLLLANNATVNAAASDDMNALHFCAMKGHVEPARLILAAGLHVDSRTRKGMTALAMACQGGHFALAEFLIKKKASPLVVNKQERSIMQLCKTAELRELIEKAIKDTEQQKAQQASKALERAEGGESGGKRKDRGHMRGRDKGFKSTGDEVDMGADGSGSGQVFVPASKKSKVEGSDMD